MRTVPVSLGGVTYHLLLNGTALFDLYDRFGDKGSLTDHFQGNTRESFAALCYFLTVLAEQGELWRRYMGHNPGPIPTEEELRLLLIPNDVPAARGAVIDALLAGFRREEGEKPRTVDKGLLALQKKNGSGLRRGEYLHIAVRFLGLELRAALLLPVGLVFDMLDLESRRWSSKKERK